MSIAYLFPGQGAQSPGMGRLLCERFTESQAVFEEAAEVLAFDIQRLCFEGPADKLTSTDIAQPAILVTSVACMRAMQARGLPEPSVALGHSLGEFTALVAAGALEFADALRLVRKRGLLMREAGQAVGGAMAAVIGLPVDSVEDVLDRVADGRVLVTANLNAPDQVVISGERAAVLDAGEALQEAGARRVVPLPVSGAFHSPLMAPAAEKLAAEIDAAPFRDAVVPVIQNATAEAATDTQVIRQALKAQVTSRVRWVESVSLLEGMGCTYALEMGAKNVLSGLVRRIAPGLATGSAWDADSASECLAALGGAV